MIYGHTILNIILQTFHSLQYLFWMSKDLYIRLLSVGQELLYFLSRHCQPIFIKRGRIIECKLEYTSTIRCAAKQWSVSIIFIHIFSYARARKKDYLARPVGQFRNPIPKQIVAMDLIYLCIVVKL